MEVKQVFWTLLIVGGCFIFYKIATFKIIDEKLIFLNKAHVINRDYSLIFYHYPSNATIQGSIQVHLINDETGKIRFRNNFDRYNKILFYTIGKNQELKIGVQDTTNTRAKIDTVSVVLPDRY